MMFRILLLTVGCSVSAQTLGDDWPQWRGSHRDGVWRESGIVKTLPKELKYKWRTPIGAGFTGPAVWRRRVFVTDFVRQGAEPGDDVTNNRGKDGQERVICLDAQSGSVEWTYDYPCRYEVDYASGPRATPTVHEGNVYSVGAMGDFVCLDVLSGEKRWGFNFVKDYGTKINAWGMAAAPLIDGDQVVLLVGGAKDALVVARHKLTGEELWKSAYEEDPGYAPPVIVEAGGTRQLIVWTPLAIRSLDPSCGRVLWKHEFKSNASLSLMTPIHVRDKRQLFVSSFYNGPLMLSLNADRPAAEVQWRGTSDSEIKTDKLHSLMCTPVIRDGHIYGVCSYGQLRCIDAATGERRWETLEATGSGRWWNAFLIPHEDRFFICNEQGELIIARLTPQGYEELSRAFLIKPTQTIKRRKIVWSHPAFANRCVFARNDQEIVCVDLTDLSRASR